MPHTLNANDAAQAEAEAVSVVARHHWLTRALRVDYVLICVLYGAVAWLSLGYNDGFSNMGLVEQHGLGVMALMQTQDVHPPGQYFTNWLLPTITGDWSLVLLADYRVKQQFEARYPEYQFDISTYRDAWGLAAPTAWQPIALRNHP